MRLIAIRLACLLILVLLSPVLSSIAGSRGNKLSFLKFFTLGALSCMGCFFFKSADQGALGAAVQYHCEHWFYGSLVFWQRLSAEIASPAQQDMLSARLFAWLCRLIIDPDYFFWY